MPDDLPTASLNGLPSTDSTGPLPSAPSAASTAPGGGPVDPFEAWVTGAARSDRYRLLHFHKGGGLGQVWKATDTVLDREVAVKLLRPDRVNPGLVARFVREAKVTGRLEHPNIVPLYDLVQTADGPAYAMRFVRGQNLAEAAKGYHARRAKGAAGPLELPRLLGAVALVCEAVAFAHSEGVLHRDLKGQNILLGEFGEVCLADWGLAKVATDPDQPGDPSPLRQSPDDPLTEQGAVMGTLAFMAPELARREPASVASDVYGLGAVLYQVLTNAVPNTGTTPEEVLSKLESGVPALPARRVNPSLPPALAAVCEKALSRHPADRYPSAEGLAADIRAYLAGEPVGAYPEPFLVRAGRWVRRHRAGVLAGVVGLAVLAAAATVAAVLVWQEKERTEGQRRAAVAAQERAEREREKAETLLAVLVDYSTGLAAGVTPTERGQSASRQTMAARKAAVAQAAAAAERVVAALPDDPAQRAQLAKLLRYTANLARMTNDRAAAETAYGSAARILQELVEQFPADPGRRRELALLREDEATLRLVFGRPAEAVAALDAADGLLAGLAPAERDQEVSRRAAGLLSLGRATAGIQLGRFDAAAAAAREAAARFAALDADLAGRYPHDPVFRGLALIELARAGRERVRFHGGALTAAQAANDEAVAVLQAAAVSGAHPDVRHNLYHALVDRVRTRLAAGEAPADALPDLDRAVAGWEELIDRDPGLPTYRHQLAGGLTVRGRVRAAAADLDRAVGLLETLVEEAAERPAYRADLSAAWAGLARLRTDKVAAQDAYRKAGSTARGAISRGPGNVLYPRWLDELTREAKAAGFDVGAPKPAAGR